MKQIQSQANSFGKKFKSFLQFEAWIKTKKKAILFHPDYVLMTWETYRDIAKPNKPLIIEDEVNVKFWDEVKSK